MPIPDAIRLCCGPLIRLCCGPVFLSCSALHQLQCYRLEKHAIMQSIAQLLLHAAMERTLDV